MTEQKAESGEQTASNVTRSFMCGSSTILLTLKTCRLNNTHRAFLIDKCELRQSKRLIKFQTAYPREVDLNPVASGDIFRLCLVSFRGLPVSLCRPLQFRFMEISLNRNPCQAWQTALMRSTFSACVCVQILKQIASCGNRCEAGECAKPNKLVFVCTSMGVC